jgi:DNA-binding transcriptional regulator YdaS (Cro superfamily)
MPWSRDRSERDLILAPAIAAAGGESTVAKKLVLSRAAVHQWRRVPEARVAMFARLSGFPPHMLRPDLYDKNGRRLRVKPT